MFGADLQCNGRLQCSCTCTPPPPAPPGLAPAAAAGDDVASVRPDSVYILHTVLPRPAQLCFPTLDAAAGWPVIGGASAHSVL